MCYVLVRNELKNKIRDSSFYTETRTEETTKIVYHAISKKSASYDSEPHASSSTKPYHPPQKTHASLTNAAVRHYGYRMRLYCRNGYNLLISPDKTVRGDAYGDNSSGKECLLFYIYCIYFLYM